MQKATKKTTKTEVKVQDLKPKKDPKGGFNAAMDSAPKPRPQKAF